MKFKKGDQVIVTVGKNKGKKGQIERIFLKEGKVLIPGINIFKKHLKRRSEKRPGGIVEISKPLSLSKVALLCPKCGQLARVGYKKVDREKFRVCKKCREEI